LVIPSIVGCISETIDKNVCDVVSECTSPNHCKIEIAQENMYLIVDTQSHVLSPALELGSFQHLVNYYLTSIYWFNWHLDSLTGYCDNNGEGVTVKNVCIYSPSQRTPILKEYKKGDLFKLQKHQEISFELNISSSGSYWYYIDFSPDGEIQIQTDGSELRPNRNGV